MGKWFLTVFGGLWITCVFLATDMYLPALPLLDDAFNTSEATVNLTLLTFNLAIPVGALVGGPLADRLGRFKPTFTGGVLCLVGTVLCAIAPNIGLLIAFRVIAGFGGGIVIAIIYAIMSDCLEGEDLDSAIAAAQSLSVIGPVIAPFLGSIALGFVGWRGIFWFLSAVYLVFVLIYLRIGETMPVEKRVQTSVPGALRLIVDIAKNMHFTVLLVTLCFPALCFGVFLTTCSYVYIDFFSLSNLTYSVLYAIPCFVVIIAPFCYTALVKRLGNYRMIWLLIALLVFSGLWIVLFGSVHPILFLIGTVPFCLAEGMARPCAFLVLMRIESERSGAASALINFGVLFMTALGTPAASLPWSTHVMAMGVPTLVASVIAALLFIILLVPMKTDIIER